MCRNEERRAQSGAGGAGAAPRPVHTIDDERLVFDMIPRHDLESGTWAKMNADRITSFGVLAVATPQTNPSEPDMGVRISDREMELADEVVILRGEYAWLSLEMERLKLECVRQVRESYENGRAAGREEGRQEESYYSATYPGS